MMTESEFRQTEQRIKESSNDPVVGEARRIASQDFASDESLGSLRMREHPLWNSRLALFEFLSALKALFRIAE